MTATAPSSDRSASRTAGADDILAEGVDFFSRSRWAWHGLFGALVVVAATFLVIDGHAWAVTLLAALVAAYLLAFERSADYWGCGETPVVEAIAGPLYLAVAYAVVGVLAWQDPNTLVLLFMIFPQTYVTLRLRAAIVGTCLLTAIYTGVLFAREGWSARALETQGVGSVATAVFAVAVGAFVGGLARQSEQRRRLLAELTAAKVERDDAQRAADVAAERERLARDIHDTLAQDFTSVVMLAQAASAALAAGEAGAAATRLEQIGAAAREGLVEARALVASMQPAALDGRTLEAALARLAARFTAETGVPASFETSVEASPGARAAFAGDREPSNGLGAPAGARSRDGLAASAPRARSTTVDVVLLRAAQEALANVRRHAGARSVALHLVQGAGRTVVEVVDDGHGFDPTMPSDGFGLDGMRARAGDVGGRVTVDSGPGGTRVRVSVGE